MGNGNICIMLLAGCFLKKLDDVICVAMRSGSKHGNWPLDDALSLGSRENFLESLTWTTHEEKRRQDILGKGTTLLEQSHEGKEEHGA